MGFYPRTHAVWGAMSDKDLGGMITKMRPLVDAWYCCDSPTGRAARADQLKQAIDAEYGGAPL